MIFPQYEVSIPQKTKKSDLLRSDFFIQRNRKIELLLLFKF